VADAIQPRRVRLPLQPPELASPGLVFYRLFQQIVVTPPTMNEQLYRGW